ncbi:MAG: HipA domain-containing protein, partial [Alkalispirochaeta sp.]
LSATDNAGGWHRGCARRFFGRPEVPEVAITAALLEELARRSVETGQTVTGVQKKLSVHLSDTETPRRLTLVGFPAGYILKPPSSDYPELPELEHTTMRMAQRIGLKVVPHGLIELGDGERAYITRRIDRTTSAQVRIPMEDLCQLSERLTEDKYRGSYEQAGKVIARYSSRPGLDLSDYFFLLVFSFVTGNSDMHLKNFSLYCPESEWILSPAYDLLPTALVIPEDREEVALTLNGKKRRIGRGDLVALGENLGVNYKAVRRIIDAVSGHRETLISTVEESFLSAELKTAYVALLKERIGLL